MEGDETQGVALGWYVWPFQGNAGHSGYSSGT